MLLLCHFAPADPASFLARAERTATLLSAQPGCTSAEVGRAVDDPTHWVLTARFVSVGEYRRALRPYPIREHVVPLLSEAMTDGSEPATFEVLATAVDGVLSRTVSLRAEPTATASEPEQGHR